MIRTLTWSFPGYPSLENERNKSMIKTRMSKNRDKEKRFVKGRNPS